MTKTFEELKRRSESGDAFETLRGNILFDYKSHKRKRLERAGLKDSGTLLHSDVAEHHHQILFREWIRRAEKIGTIASSRLRHVTILQETTNSSVEGVARAVEDLRTQYARVFGGVRLWSRGVIELEMVNLGIFRLAKAKTEGEKRKLQILEGLRKTENLEGLTVPEDLNKTNILVHCHVLVDFGKDFEMNREEVRRLREELELWKTTGYQFEVDPLYSTKTVRRNLYDLSEYVVKGGNPTLRFNFGFERDLLDDEEKKMLKEEKKARPNHSNLENLEDIRALKVGDVRKLDQCYRWLMDRRHDKRGYLITSSDR